MEVLKILKMYSPCFTFSNAFFFFFAGVVDVAIKAEAVTSDISCNNEIVSVPDRGRIDLVKKTLIVKVGFEQKDSLLRTLFCV